MTRIQLIIAGVLGLPLLGCQPTTAPPMTPGEQALANLTAHLKQYGEAGSRMRPNSCEDGASDRPTLLCYADLVELTGGEPKKVGSSAFSCSVKPGGTCSYMPPGVVEDAVKTRATAATATGCDDTLRPGLSIDLHGIGSVTVSDYTARDTDVQAWVNVSFTLQDADVRLTENQVKTALDQLSDRIAKGCRSHSLQKSRIFLYPAGVTAGESATWIARLDDTGTRHIDLNRGLLKDERADRYACVAGKEPGISLDEGTKLPPVRQREIIGTWVGMDVGMTMSLERVKGKVYRVYRDAYCNSGDRGELLQARSGSRYAVIDSRSGDYYAVMPSGDLGVFDREGKIDVMPKHSALFPAASPK